MGGDTKKPIKIWIEGCRILERCVFEAEGKEVMDVSLSSLHRGMAPLRSVVSLLGFWTVICRFLLVICLWREFLDSGRILGERL